MFGQAELIQECRYLIMSCLLLLFSPLPLPLHLRFRLRSSIVHSHSIFHFDLRKQLRLPLPRDSMLEPLSRLSLQRQESGTARVRRQGLLQHWLGLGKLAGSQ